MDWTVLIDPAPEGSPCGTKTHPALPNLGAFNSNGIVYDNTPWRPGREMDLVDNPMAEDDERKLKNLATRIMSNGVEVLVKDKSADSKQEQRKFKSIIATSLKPHYHMSSQLPKQSLLSSAVATFINHQQMSALFPLHQLMQHNYVIKTCMTTYTYLTTIIHNKRSAISTFETILSVVTTESLTNLYSTDMPDVKPTKTNYMEVKTIQPTTSSNMFVSNFPKIDKRIDNPDDGESFDLIQPSEHGHTPCTTSCSCSHTKTEGLKTRYSNLHDHTLTASKYGIKTSKYGASKIDLRPTKVEPLEKKTQNGPYEYEATQLAPTDRIVEKYTEVINDYSDEKDSNSVEESELLTNEQAPAPPKTNKISNNKNQEKPNPEKPQKPNKNKVLVADLLKLGSLGIKGLSQLAPVFEKMTGGFIKRPEPNKTTTTTTVKPVEKLTPYQVNKRLDSELEYKHMNFPIYIPVDELETSESQMMFTNATLHQNMAWAAEHKQPKAHIVTPKVVHESPLVNGGIPISPGEIITANSDVIVGKPAVGGPLTLAASGIKLHNPVNPPPLDSFVAGSEQFFVKEKPSPSENNLLHANVDDSFDLRPPEPPKSIPKPSRPILRPVSIYNHPNPPSPPSKLHPRLPIIYSSDQMMKTEHIKGNNNILGNHGRPVFLDYIPSLAKPSPPPKSDNKHKPENENHDDIADNSPSSSEIVNSKVTPEGEIINKPLLVDIQPSRVANVLIPHGSATALVFAGSSEPHKTGEYVDDPLPYPEPGYFGSFSIDAPQMTNVHNVAPSNKPPVTKATAHPILENHKLNIQPPYKDHSIRNDLKYKWKDTKRPLDYSKLPPPTSNQETHLQVGPQITVYNPDVYKQHNGEFEKYNHPRPTKYKDGHKEHIDKEYENFLAVPPPPPPKIHFSQESHYDKNKPYNQRPVVHTKPIQDMKVFLNIQHPIPKQPSQDALPPKVTSEIYFAAQAPNSKPAPTYTIHMPSSPPTYGNVYNQIPSSPIPQNIPNNAVSHSSDSFTVVSSPNFSNKSIFTNDVNVNQNDNTYTVTLKTATNVASNVGESAQVIGTSIPVAVGTATVDQMNTDIPIGTNFAIRVEDGSSSDGSPFENYNTQSNRHPQTSYDNYNRNPNVAIGDNRWNFSYTEHKPKDTTVIGHHYFNQNSANDHKVNDNPSIAPSVNSHANFPMMNVQTTSTPSENIKPVTEYIEEKNEQKRPAKLIPNIPTNSHGWYSSVLMNENTLNKINKIVVEQPTTRKIIPLLHEYNKEGVPDFGQKITSAGKPPSEFWAQKYVPNDQNKYDVGKPFTTQQTSTNKPVTYSSNFNIQPYNPEHIPSYFGGMKQPAYDIPIHDNSDETTTVKIEPSTDKIKPVYENSEEVYDGEEKIYNNNDEDDGEVSQESIKVPVVTTSSEEQSTPNLSKTTTKITLAKDEFYESTETTEKNVFVDFYPGTQTEKPFTSSNKTTFQSNAMKPIYQMRPRPFTTSTLTTLDHQLQQPHWQINQLMINSTNTASYEDGLDLNIGEEMDSVPQKSTTRVPSSVHDTESKYKRPPRPIYYTHDHDNVSNIITSTINIKDKKPLIVEKHPSTLSPISLTTIEINRSSSEILDLSPPPPTLEYSFKPSANDEMIMGMNPPPPVTAPSRLPQRTHPTSKPFANRTPPNYRTKPPRTLPPRVSTTPRPVRRPIIREEVSTYKPTFDIHSNIKRPIFNRDQPLSQLLPPPRDMPSRISPINELPSPSVNIPSSPNVVFPTPISSGWLTSSGIDFSPSFEFGPTSVQFPEASASSKIPNLEHSTEISSINSYEVPSSSERNENQYLDKPTTEGKLSDSKESSTEFVTKKPTSSEENTSDAFASETSQEDTTTDRMKVVPISHKNRTRKPYPIRHDDRKSSISKYRTPSRPTSIIRPTRTINRPDILFPTRQTSSRKIVRPIPTKSHSSTSSIIESSESSIDDDFVKPTEVLKDITITPVKSEKSTVTEKPSSSVFTPSLEDSKTVQPTHHAGNEIKISDEIIPTKTEFKTTVVTLTKTLSEPPRTVSSIGYLNITHTLTVTHTMTSLISQSEGAVTQTLVLTNTHTSTIVDVVTEVHTQVQPTTIVETVTKHIPIPNVEPTPVQDMPAKTKTPLDDLTMSSEENENLIIKGTEKETTENTIQKIETETEGENDTFFVVMNKSQSGGKVPPIGTEIETGDYDITRNEQVNNNGVSQVLFGEILLAGTPYLETTNVVAPGIAYMKECQPDCKASRNERCQRIDGMMKCVCRPGFARMFPDRPCKPTYTYSVKLALGSQGKEQLKFDEKLYDNTSKEYHTLAVATHEGINRMVMQSDLRDVYHGVHITGFQPVEVKREEGDSYQGVMNDFYVQLSDNAHESRLKEVIEKYLRNNNYSLGGTDVHAAAELVEKLDVSDFDECTSGQFHDCSEHAQCFNLRGTYTCSCLEGFADLSVNTLYPGRICSAEPVGCELCNYHGACYSRDDRRVLCECFQWYAGSTCHINLKVVLISLVVLGALLTIVLTVCAVVACRRPRPPPRSIVTCIQGMPSFQPGAMPKQRADRRALISDRTDSGDASSVQNASLPYMPTKRVSTGAKKCVMSEPPAHDPPPVPAPAVMIPRARLHPHHDSRENISRKKSMELSSEAKLISYLESGAVCTNEEMRRKHSMESSYSANKERHNKQGALVSAGFKVSTTIRPDEPAPAHDTRRRAQHAPPPPHRADRDDDDSSINKNDLEAELHFDSLMKSFSQEDLSEWTDAERRIGELTLSEARSVGGTLPASTGRAASSTRLTHQEANTMAERDLGSTFLLPHVHLYKPDLTSDVSEFDSL